MNLELRNLIWVFNRLEPRIQRNENVINLNMFRND